MRCLCVVTEEPRAARLPQPESGGAEWAAAAVPAGGLTRWE